MSKTRFREIIEERYQELLDEEAAYLYKLYELDLEEMDIANEDHWYHIKEAKRKVGAELDEWWRINRQEYQDLREILDP